MVVSANLRHVTEQQIDELMTQVKGVKAIVVASEDGFEVAARVQNAAQISRLSAMASSIAALGAMAGAESQLGDCHSLLMQADFGHIAILQVRRADVSLIVSVITDQDAVVGQVLYASKKMAQTLRDTSA